MKTHGICLRKISGFRRWLSTWLLYRRAFPRSERKPFGIIVSMWRRGKTDVWCAEKDGRFLGFASTINDSDLVLLDYLAVSERMRSRGIGGHILHCLKESYGNRGLLVEIESAFEAGTDCGQRVRRRQFYLQHGMVSQKVIADVFGVKMELLGWNCCVDFERYHRFYLENYSQYAADHILPGVFPGEE